MAFLAGDLHNPAVKNPRVGVIAVILAIVALLMIAWVLMPRRTSLSLAEGRTVEGIEFTAGTNHVGQWGFAAYGWFYTVLPPALRSHAMRPPLRATVTTSTNALVLWLRVRSDGLWRAPDERQHDSFECTLLDSNGTAVAASLLTIATSSGIYGDDRTLRYAVFPPHAGATRVRIRQHVARNGMITFKQPVPPGGGLLGAELHPESIEIRLPRRH